MDNLGILVQAILSLKDTKASKDQIASELPKLESQLQSDKNTRVKIVAGLDIAKSKNLIQSQLNTLANQVKAPTIKIGVDTSGLNSVQGATQNITNSLQTVQTQAQNTTQSIINLEDKFKTPIKPVFNSDGLINAEETILRVKQHFQELGEVSVKGQYSDKNAVDSLDTMIVKIQNGQKEARSLTFELDKAGKAFYLKSGTSDNSGVAKLSTQIDETRAKYNRLLADFKSSNSAIQSGLTQPIQQFETVLNGLGKTSSINDVKNAFESLKQSASDITQYLETTNSAFNKATNAVNHYKDMDNILKEITASFDKLSTKPSNLKSEIDSTKKKLLELHNIEKQEGTNVNWAKKYREVNIELVQLRTNIKLAERASKDDDKANNDLRIEFVQKLNNAYKQLISYKNKLASTTNTDSQKAYTDEIIKTEKIIDNLIQQLKSGKLITAEIQNQIDLMNEQVTLTDRINKNKLSDARGKQAVQTFEQQAKQLRDYTTQIDNAIKKLNGLQNSTVFRNNASNSQVIAEKDKISALVTAYQNLKAQLNGNITSAGLENIGNQLTQLNARFNTTTATAKQFETELKNDNGAEKLAQRVALLKAQIEAYAKANPKAMKKFGDTFNSMIATLNSSPDKMNVDRVAKEFQTVRQEINKTDLAGKTFFQNLKDKINKFTGWMSMTYAISLVTRTIRSMITEVVNLDTALIDLKKTFGGTDTDLKNLYISANKTAKELGVTTKDILEQASAWSRLGSGV